MKKPKKSTFHVGIGQSSYAILARTVSSAVRQAARLAGVQAFTDRGDCGFKCKPSQEKVSRWMVKAGELSLGHGFGFRKCEEKFTKITVEVAS